METLENTIKYTFKNKELLKTALIHKSYLNSNKTKDENSNERLEFLGDSVLGFVTAEYLYKNYPLKDEGECQKSAQSSFVKIRLQKLQRTGIWENIFI